MSDQDTPERTPQERKRPKKLARVITPKAPPEHATPSTTADQGAEAHGGVPRIKVDTERRTQPDKPQTPRSETPTSSQRRKPRKLVQRSPPTSPVVQSTPIVAPPEQPAAPDAAATDTDPLTNLHTRMSSLETKYQDLDQRLLSTTTDVQRLRRKPRPHKIQPTHAHIQHGTGGRATPHADEPREITSDDPSAYPNTLIPTTAAAQGGESDVEEIPRATIDGEDRVTDVEDIPRPKDDGGLQTEEKSVTLSGNYRIPLPSTLSPADVKAIQDGVAAAGSIAKELKTAMRSSSNSRNVSTTRAEQEIPRKELIRPDESGRQRSWGQWINNAGRAVLNAIEVDAAIEKSSNTRTTQSSGATPRQRRPNASTRSTTANSPQTPRQRATPRSEHSSASKPDGSTPASATGRRRSGPFGPTAASMARQNTASPKTATNTRPPLETKTSTRTKSSRQERKERPTVEKAAA